MKIESKRPQQESIWQSLPAEQAKVADRLFAWYKDSPSCFPFNNYLFLTLDYERKIDTCRREQKGCCKSKSRADICCTHKPTSSRERQRLYTFLAWLSNRVVIVVGGSLVPYVLGLHIGSNHHHLRRTKARHRSLEGAHPPEAQGVRLSDKAKRHSSTWNNIQSWIRFFLMTSTSNQVEASMEAVLYEIISSHSFIFSLGIHTGMDNTFPFCKLCLVLSLPKH